MQKTNKQMQNKSIFIISVTHVLQKLSSMRGLNQQWIFHMNDIFKNKKRRMKYILCYQYQMCVVKSRQEVAAESINRRKSKGGLAAV